MQMNDLFMQNRIQNKRYVRQIQSFPFFQYENHEGWTDSILNQDLIFSHRKTWYTPENFLENLHAHDYYEIDIYVKGNIEYVKEDKLISAYPFTVVWFKPGEMHTTRLLSSCQYERYILYFSTAFFCIDDRRTPITDFIEHPTADSLRFSEKNQDELLDLLKKIEITLMSDKSYKELLTKALFVQFFDLLNSSEAKTIKGIQLQDSTAEIKQYIDTYYTSITSVDEIAEHFFYSREHLSRKFKQMYNISVAQYLSRKRIQECIPLLTTMSISDVAYAVGFHNSLSFINAFKKNMGCLPSEYKARL